MFGSNQQGNEMYLPVQSTEAFKALCQSASKHFSVKSVDDFTMTCSFTSGASMFTWGEKFTAQVVPTGEGCTIRVSGVGKVGGQLQQGSRTAKLITQLLEDISSALRPAK